MVYRLSTSLVCLLLAFGANAQAQESRTIHTGILDLDGAPIKIASYEATYSIFEEGFISVEYLEEAFTLENRTADEVVAIELGIVYAGAFGDEIDRVVQTLIKDVDGRASITETYRLPFVYDMPVYAAAAYVSRVRRETNGEGPPRIWRADSSEVQAMLEKTLFGFRSQESSE